MYKKILIITLGFLGINLLFSACNQTKEFNFRITSIYIEPGYAEDQEMAFFDESLSFHGELTQIASLSSIRPFNEAYAFQKTSHTLYIKNPPLSIRIFSEIEVDSTMQEGDDISHLFNYRLADGVENPYELNQPYPLKITTKYPDEHNVILNYKNDNSPAGYRQFRVMVILEDGTLFEYIFPRFYLTK